MKYILLFIFVSYSFSQSKYPADTLITSTNINIIQKIGLLPIAAWQRISYNSNYFNCQFYPSCSNYGASAIKRYGFIKGTIIGSDRITRCNPFAVYYHLELGRPFNDKDGRLIDPIAQNQNIKSKKSPTIAAILSIIPGAGRLYSGRKLDGLMGLWTVYLTTSSAYFAKKNNNKLSGPLFLGIAGITYLGEIYGSWRTAKYYQKAKTDNI
mgnify:CR=1 FL=1